MKVYGYNAWVPTGWPIEASPNGNRQRLVVVAAPSLAEALRAFGLVGIDVTRHSFRGYGFPDMGGRSAEVALLDPGRVYYQPGDSRGDIVPAPLATQASSVVE